MKSTLLRLGLVSFVLISALTCVNAQRINKGNERYKVVVNHEEQYQVLPVSEKNERGWKDTSFSGSLSECMDHIEEVWTDMRPLSIREMKLPRSTSYGVVINHEEQYMIWPKDQKPAAGWKFTEFSGDLKECMQFIEEVWTDMRPKPFRR